MAALFGAPVSRLETEDDAALPDSPIRLFAVLAQSGGGALEALSANIAGDAYPALTLDCPQAHWFEREIAEQWGVRPEGHPWMKPIRFHPSYRKGKDAWGRAIGSPAAGASVGSSAGAAIEPGVTDFFHMEGEEIHEVAVGPVHAGVIEPGHFRFQCHGEHVYHLEISLGFQHRGVERALVGGPDKRTMHYMETLAGDTTIGHGSAYCQAVEALAQCAVPARAQALRAIALELERLANHTGDLGALAGDVGFLPTMSYCGRIRGDFLNMTALVCGNRFGRGLTQPGGVLWDMDDERIAELRRRLDQGLKDVTGAVNLLWDSPSAAARFEETGTVPEATARELGLVGPAARACGVERDVRYEYPYGLYRFAHVPISIADTGDVYARAQVRWLEIQRSVEFIQDQLERLPGGGIGVRAGAGVDGVDKVDGVDRVDKRPTQGLGAGAGAGAGGRGGALSLPPERFVVSLVEGWRGEICHVAITNADGRFAAYKVVDPSFHNWMGLAMAMRDQQISDFPLCNKSFNLSYCGHDL
ncbi:MAG: NADH-quinone oxidoreductase subunit C [Candidatus Sumerlaeota bacterium]|nr:NADH-quinone oxidoreductase subunit C [Candidatus Sumerlaeota bacterium]